MVRVGKKFLAALFGVGALALGGVGAHAATITLAGTFLNETETVNGNLVTYNFALSTDSTKKSGFLVTVDDQEPPTPYSYIQGTPGLNQGTITSFSASITYDTTAPLTTNLVSGTFSLSLNGSGPISGTILSGSGHYLPTGFDSNSGVDATATFPGSLPPISILNFSGGGIAADIAGTQIAQTPGSNYNNANITLSATIAGASNPTPLPAAAWGGLGLMGALGVGAMARRRRA